MSKPAPALDVADGPKTSHPRGGAVEASAGPDPVSGEAWLNASCSKNYLVLARLFKLHPDFDAAVEGILAGDAGGCVVLIHETRDEEWTQVVWNRLRERLVPRGICVFRIMCLRLAVKPGEGTLPFPGLQGMAKPQRSLLANLE